MGLFFFLLFLGLSDAGIDRNTKNASHVVETTTDIKQVKVNIKKTNLSIHESSQTLDSVIISLFSYHKHELLCPSHSELYKEADWTSLLALKSHIQSADC